MAAPVVPWDFRRNVRNPSSPKRPDDPAVLKPYMRRLRYHPVQRQAWIEDKRFVAIPAGRRSGKTDMAIQRTIRKALQPYPWRARFGLAAPTRQQAKNIFWRRLRDSIPPFLVAETSVSDLKVYLLNGSEIQVVGMEVPQRVEGFPWDGFVLDEFANMRPEAWQNHVRPALADRQGWAWKIGVPEGRNHFWEICQQYQLDPTYGFYTWISADILPASEIEQLRRDLDPRTFRQELEASFEEAMGRIYYAFDRTQDVHEFPLLVSIGGDDTPWRGGIDFNVAPMCAVWGWETKERDPFGREEQHIWIWRELWMQDNADTAAAGAEIRGQCQMDRTFGRFEMHPDPTGNRRDTRSGGVSDHALLRQAGFKVRSRPAPPLRRNRYNAVNTMFCDGSGRRRIHIHPRCRQLIRCLEGMMYAEGSNEPDKQKSVDMDHITDALGYWVEKRHRLSFGVKAINF